jgi:hypothetical protein
VLRGEGVCPISESLAPQIRQPGLVLRPLDPPLLVPLLLAWQDPATVVLRALIEDTRATHRLADPVPIRMSQ